MVERPSWFAEKEEQESSAKQRKREREWQWGEVETGELREREKESVGEDWGEAERVWLVCDGERGLGFFFYYFFLIWVRFG